MNAEDFPRGITPQILLSQVSNTVPYLFAPDAETFDKAPYLQIVRDSASTSESELAHLSHLDYFKLCVSAHFATVSSFVPTDVDNQIRFRLWHPGLPVQTLRQMAEFALLSRSWDLTLISERFVRATQSKRVLSGMHGEWFSIAAGAYCATRKKDADLAQALSTSIRDEMEQEAAILAELYEARDGIGLLKAASSVAHNLGDLDRVMDQWNLDADDPLRMDCYKAGHDDSPEPSDSRLYESRRWLVAAGALYKTPIGFTAMADENHRHFALRAAKCLRRSRDLLLPIAPFYDAWGETVGKHPALSPEEIAEVVSCLMDGWEKLKPTGRTQTYPRALAGIESSFPGGLSRLCQYLPAKAAKNLRTGTLRTFCATSRLRFEEQLATQALIRMKGFTS